MNLALRRRKPRTIVGKVIRAWPWVLFGLRVMRFVRRAQRVIPIVLITGAGALVFAIVRRLRRRRELPPTTNTPPPATPPGFGGGTRETGDEAGPGTQTERRLEAIKDSDGGGDKSPTFESAPDPDVPPPVEEEPPAST
ncbi:MAG TPA: hypothetical protein VGJ70_12330 [Solirubrobacteraceae bacterium]